MKNDGWFQVWVYGREGNGWIIYFINPIRSITSRIPLGILNVLSWPVALPLLLCAKTLYQLPWLGNRLPYSPYIRWIASFSLRKVHAIVLDHALTPVAHYMTRADCENMVQNTGWTISEIVHNRSMSWGLASGTPSAAKRGSRMLPRMRSIPGRPRSASALAPGRRQSGRAGAFELPVIRPGGPTGPSNPRASNDRSRTLEPRKGG